MATPNGIEVSVKSSAFKKRIRSHSYKNMEYIDLIPFLAESQRVFIYQTKLVLRELKRLKAYAILEAKFVRPMSDGDEKEQIANFYLQSKLKEITLTTPRKSWFKKNITDVVMAKVDELQENGSGWSLHEIVSLDVHYNKFRSFQGSSYLEPSNSIKNKKAIINIQNKNNECFIWAILSALHPTKKHAQRPSKYKQFKNELNFDGIEFPVKLDDIDTFEELNPDISVNVYIIQREYSVFTEKNEDITVPVRLTKSIKKRHIHLLLLFLYEGENDADNSDDELCFKDIMDIIEKSTVTHYEWIKNLSALIQKQVTKNDGHKKHICDRCLNYFYTEVKLKNHLEVCESLNETKITLPDYKYRWLRFENFKNVIEVPFIIYAGIESLLMTNEQILIENKTPKGAVQKHIPNSIGYHFHSRIDPNMSYYENFSGPYCIDQFIDKMESLMQHVVWPKIHEIEPMKLTDEEEDNFNRATVCHICSKGFHNVYEKKNKKTRDHCHLTGNYRGATHSKCNILFQISKSVSVVFHNLDYDSHFLIEKVTNAFPGNINIIPKNSERYISFSKELPDYNLYCDDENYNGNEDKDVDENIDKNANKDVYEKKESNYRERLKLRFIDSYRFLQCSSAKLAKSLPPNKLNITQAQWSNLIEDQLQLLTKKGVYPYCYVDSWGKLDETQ